MDLDSPKESITVLLGLSGGLGLSPMPMGDMASIMGASKALEGCLVTQMKYCSQNQI